MKMNRELKWWEKLLKRVYIPYIKFSYYRDAFDDWRIEIYRAGWRFQPKEYYPIWTEEAQRRWEQAAMEIYREFKKQKKSLCSTRYDAETGPARPKRSVAGNLHELQLKEGVLDYVHGQMDSAGRLPEGFYYDCETGAYTRRGPIANRDLGDEA